MFSLALFTLVVTAGSLSFATPTERAPAIEVSLSAPKSVHSIDDIKVTAAVTNTGFETIKILKYGTVLDSDLPTRSFHVSKDGIEADFTGVKVSLNMANLDDSAFVVIPAGETVTVEHEVAPLFNFETLGTGVYTFEPKTTFQVIEDSATPNAYKAFVQNFDVEVMEDVTKRKLTAHDKRSTVSCSSPNLRNVISSSYTEGKSLASIASSYVAANGADALYRSYFGSTSTSTVRRVLDTVANENSNSRTLNCNDPYGVCNGNVIAYTLTATTNIYYCSIFYNEVASSNLCYGTTVAARNIRGGTTLHELTHATSGTDDIGYGCAYDQSLGSSNPSQAAINADNYNCFATQVYQNTQC